jgi:hypothetical protein
MTQDEKLTQILTEVSEIRRGLYGDDLNKMPGLMQKHYEVAAKVDKLEDHRKKAIWWGMGLIAGLQFAWFFVRKLFNL